MADLPVITFIQERISESEASGGAPLEVRKGTGFYDLFIKPQELMLEPLLAAMETTLISQSVRRMRNLEDPDAFDESLVDDGVGNVYIERDVGDFARTTVRVFYETPVARELPEFSAEFTAGDLSFFNEGDFTITAQQMSIQQIGTLYYMDVPVRAQEEGDDYNVEPTDITQFVNDPEAVSVSNLTAAIGGLPKETNTILLDRAKDSIGVRDLETVKGINAILKEKFTFIREIKSIGFGDPEMMRDILYNVHTGGYTDVYIKTPELSSVSKNIIGLQFDYTRELARNIHMELTALDYSDPEADLNSPNIVSMTVSVKDDVIESAAYLDSITIPSPAGIDLSANQWIRLKVDNGVFYDIKIAGATPTSTQRFEIINSINAAVGIAIAQPNGTTKFRVTSPTAGVNSLLTFTTPGIPKTDGTLNLFPDAALAGYVANTTDGVFQGIGPDVYTENIDFEVDYAEGKIKKLPFSSILSGDTIAASPPILPQHPGDSGLGTVGIGSNVFTTGTAGAFDDVRAGDTITIVDSPLFAVPLGEYVVQEKISGTSIKIQGMSPTAVDVGVEYFITSNQVVIVDFKYNPLSVDVGNLVDLGDGTRGIRPGREAYTITDMTFVDIESIEEIDSATGEGIGVFLVPPGGFGSGGFGLGGFGNTGGGDYRFIVNKPVHRFSAFEDSLIVFDPSLYGRSYKITYSSANQIPNIHSVCRDDIERVTGADVLPKNFVPGFVSIDINVRPDVTNSAAASIEEQIALVKSLIHGVVASEGLKASDIIKELEDSGVESVQTPFTMTGKVLNTDGSTTYYSDQDVLQVPDVTLAKETDNFVTKRIVHWYPGTINIVEI